MLERALGDPEQGPKLALAVLRAVGVEPVPKPDWVAYQLSAEVDAFLADGLGVTADG